MGKKHKIPLETMHMVDRNDVIRSCFRGGQTGVDEYIVQKSRFRLQYEVNAFFVERNKLRVS